MVYFWIQEGHREFFALRYLPLELPNGYKMKKKMLALQKYHKSFENCKTFKIKPKGIKEKYAF